MSPHTQPSKHGPPNTSDQDAGLRPYQGSINDVFWCDPEDALNQLFPKPRPAEGTDRAVTSPFAGSSRLTIENLLQAGLATRSNGTIETLSSEPPAKKERVRVASDQDRQRLKKLERALANKESQLEKTTRAISLAKSPIVVDGFRSQHTALEREIAGIKGTISSVKNMVEGDRS